MGGEEVEYGHKRYVVSYRHNGTHLCTGCLISKKHVLTAAHCLEDYIVRAAKRNIDEYSVLVGSMDMFHGGISYLILFMKTHFRFDFRNPRSVHDIALIMVGC